ncbi:MAG TPA: DUF2924 domain-containing protein [Rhodospirillaceae bacterium]|nr:DUF2924 domain-containing protein [Rhodospirillaceae bacterium]
MKNNILARVAALPQMPMPELVAMWEELFQAQPPKYNKPYLVKRLAYRLQEIAHGIDSTIIEKRLEQYAKESLSENLRKERGKGIHIPVTGTKLVRIHNGIEHRVTVLDRGFEYNGAHYRSLSHIAREITGTNWSGPMFFGLVRKNREGKE